MNKQNMRYADNEMAMALRKKKIPGHTARRMNREDVMLSEIMQHPKGQVLSDGTSLGIQKSGIHRQERAELSGG